MCQFVKKKNGPKLFYEISFWMKKVLWLPEFFGEKKASWWKSYSVKKIVVKKIFFFM